MRNLRGLICSNPQVAAALVAFVLLMRVLVPTGFMPMVDGGTITVVLCSGTGPQTMHMAMPGMAGDAHHTAPERQHDRPEAPCAFSGLGAPALSGADPVLLVAAVLFAMALAAWAPARRPIAPALRLRPPLRGPPTRS